MVDLVWEAGGDEKACVIFALLACRKYVLHSPDPEVLLSFLRRDMNENSTHGRYFKQRSLIELAESELFRLRMQACERIAKLMIDSVQDDEYLFTQVLLKRYLSIVERRSPDIVGIR